MKFFSTELCHNLILYNSRDHTQLVYELAGQLWPRVQACANEVAAEQLQPLLDECKPLWISDIKITECVVFKSGRYSILVKAQTSWGFHCKNAYEFHSLIAQLNYLGNNDYIMYKAQSFGMHACRLCKLWWIYNKVNHLHFDSWWFILQGKVRVCQAKSLAWLWLGACSFEVGEVAPTISGMKAYESDREGVADEIPLEFDFMWWAISIYMHLSMLWLNLLHYISSRQRL